MCAIESNEKKYEFCFVIWIWTRERVIFCNNIIQALNATNNNNDNDVDDDEHDEKNKNGECKTPNKKKKNEKYNNNKNRLRIMKL